MTHELAITGRTIIPSQHPAAVYLARLPSQHSQRVMKTSLTIIADILSDGSLGPGQLNWALVRYQHVAAVRARLMGICSPATANLRLAALRGVLKEAYRLEQMTVEDYHRAVDIDRIHGERLPAGRWIPPKDIKALLQTCLADDRIDGIRDAAIIATLYATGIRREELCRLKVEDYDADEGSLIILGKRNKERIVYIQGSAQRMLQAWLGLRDRRTNGHIFSKTYAAKRPKKKDLNKPKWRISGKGLKPTTIYSILAKRVQQAEVDGITPHDFRRTCFSDLMDKGVDISTVQKIAGHVNVNTTIRYDRRGDRAKKSAAKLMELPI